MADVSTITANGITYDIKDTVARNKVNNVIYTVTVASFSAFPVNITDNNITSDMVVLSCWFSNPNAIASDVTFTTADTSPQLKLTGTMGSGSTTAVITLGKSSF